MPKEYTREQFWKLYKKLPQELKEAVFSEETAENIWDVCSRNGIEDERVPEIARYTGRVLLGIIPPDEFQKTLEKELKLEKGVAKKVAQEINRFIFFPVKNSLEELYKIEITPPAKMKVAPPPEERPAEPVKEDVYREPIE
ncbi:MAG: hypothetical protein ACE5J0_00235 [Candidatus Paceibacterales bacterium]